MEDNMEVMNNEQVGQVNDEEKRSGLGTGAAMLIGGALALGITAGVKAIKNKIVDLKSRKKTYVDVNADAVVDCDSIEDDYEEE